MDKCRLNRILVKSKIKHLVAALLKKYLFGCQNHTTAANKIVPTKLLLEQSDQEQVVFFNLLTANTINLLSYFRKKLIT